MDMTRGRGVTPSLITSGVRSLGPRVFSQMACLPRVLQIHGQGVNIIETTLLISLQSNILQDGSISSQRRLTLIDVTSLRDASQPVFVSSLLYCSVVGFSIKNTPCHNIFLCQDVSRYRTVFEAAWQLVFWFNHLQNNSDISMFK